MSFRRGQLFVRSDPPAPKPAAVSIPEDAHIAGRTKRSIAGGTARSHSPAAGHNPVRHHGGNRPQEREKGTGVEDLVLRQNAMISRSSTDPLRSTRVRNPWRALAIVAVALAVVAGPASIARAADGDAALCDRAAAEPDAGIAACTRLIDAPPAGTPVADLYLKRGGGWFVKGDFAAAIRDYDQVVQRAPNSYLGYQNRGLARHRLRQYDDALKDFNRALRLASATAPLYNARGAVLNDQGDFDGAIADFDHAIEAEPGFVRAYLNRGWSNHRKRQLDRALDDYGKAVELAPKDPRGYINRAGIRIDKGQFEEAVADCGAALDIDPNSSEALTCRGEAYRLMGEYDRALADHTKAIERDPDGSVAYNNRGLVHRDKGELERATADFGAAVLRDARDDKAFANRGEIWRLRGDLNRSLADLMKAITINGASPVSLTLRGDTYRERGELDRAFADYNAALRQVGDYVAAFTGRGLAFEAKGDLVKARADYQKALSLPSNIDAEKAKPAQTMARARSEAIAKAEAEKAEVARLDAARKEAARALEARKVADERARKAKDEEERLSQRKVKTAELDAARRNARAEAEKAVAAAKEEARKAAEAELAAVRAEAAKREAELKAENARILAAQSEGGAKKRVAPRDPGRRVALVVGNSAYAQFAPLANPGRDARAIAASLKKVGFQSVKLVENVGREGMLAALKDFEDEAEKADWAVIYYAGHGIQIGGDNYLIPIDARLKADRDVQDEAVSLDRMLSTVAQARKLRVVMLDACRDNPFQGQMRRTLASRAITRGLAIINEPPGGTLVAYAAKAGQTALDGAGSNSPFAEALLRRMVEPELEINMLFRQVRDDVMRATDMRQEPFVYGSLPGENFYFSVN